MTLRAQIADLFSSGRLKFGLTQNVIVALLAIAVSIAGAFLYR